MNKKRHGFTLVEMMVTIAILGILLAIAIPSYQRFVLDTRMTTQANEFLTMLHFTRSEAVKRNTRVTICKSSDGATCTMTGDWRQGWIVFVDAPANGTLDGADVVLRVHGALEGGSTLVGNNSAADYISYLPSGQSSLASNVDGIVKLCSPVAGIAGRNVVISFGPGRTRVEPPNPACP